jgi:uncharacterized protein
MFRKWKHKITYSKRNILKHGSFFDITKYEFNCSLTSPVKIVFFSDLHIQSKNFNAIDLIREINKLEPDWIIFGGDLLTILTLHKEAKAFLKELKSKTGKLAVLGNWENKRRIWIPLSTWLSYFSDCNFTLLTNTSIKNSNFVFTGLLPDSNKSLYNLIENNNNTFNCLISHKPANAIKYLNLTKSNINLVLSGHTHGGQIRIPRFGAIKTSSEYWKLFEYGLYSNKITSTNLIISSGIGYTGIKTRLFCKSEIVYITLY